MYIFRTIKQQRTAFEFIGVLIFFMIMLTSWAFRLDIYNNSLLIEKSLVCLELNEKRAPLKIVTEFSHGVPQVCFWMKYRSGKVPRDIDITWIFDKQEVLSESQTLVSKEGIKVFYLLREDGSPLPDGSYKVIVSDKGRIMTEIPFKVVKRTK